LIIQNIHILIYDTRISLVYKTIDHLKKVFPSLIIAKNEDEFHEIISQQSFDIFLINLDVTPHDGIAITKELRATHHEQNFFIVIYSNKQDDFLYELAYNSGVDAYVNYHNTPVLMELLLKSLTKRLSKNNEVAAKNNEFRVDEERFLVIKNNMEKELPKKEFKLLLLLYKNPDKFFSKKELAANIWNDELVAAKRTIDVHIYNIRQIFGKKIIQSQKGKGYRINRKYI
jgi:two-component system alkaline phosphatase synthesis response regulator PhoP